MPFTLAHAAVVVPLGRRFPRLFSLPALVVGSLSPDFEYFARLRPVRSISHDPIGIPLLCVPAGLVVLILFDRIIKRPLIALAPSGLRSRLQPDAEPVALSTWSDWLRIVVSIAVGAASHIVWDAFTHEHGWFVDRSPLLASRIGSGPAVYKVLQHLSTVVGLSLLGVWSWRGIRARKPTGDVGPPVLSDHRRRAIIGLIGVASCAIGLVVARSQAAEVAHQGDYGLLVRTVIAMISSGVTMLLLYGLWYRWFEPRMRRAV
jgi:hypothetical protein